MRRRKELEIWLSQISGFSNPKYMLEQYPTSPELSLDILLLIQSKYGDIEGQVICDLGCGTGRLGLGCLALGAERVIGIDVDQEALEIAKDNARDLFEDEDLCNLEWRNLDVVELAGIEQLEKEVDVVVMNPPFGTRNSGVDLLFVQVGLKVRFCFWNFGFLNFFLKKKSLQRKRFIHCIKPQLGLEL
jgi:predicted RNA methylase